MFACCSLSDAEEYQLGNDAFSEKRRDPPIQLLHVASQNLPFIEQLNPNSELHCLLGLPRAQSRCCSVMLATWIRDPLEEPGHVEAVPLRLLPRISVRGPTPSSTAASSRPTTAHTFYFPTTLKSFRSTARLNCFSDVFLNKNLMLKSRPMWFLSSRISAHHSS